ncbi:MAG TPA: tetratricopeptide repeat protein [bacterium]|nr:tetratricopeptide repeat protein [bacterium]
MFLTQNKVKNWVWFLTFFAVVFAPSYRSVDYKSYAVSIGFLLLLALKAISLFKKPEIHYSPLEFYLALYVGWVCLSYFWSPVDLAASEYLGRFLPCVGFFLLMRQEGRGGDGPFRIGVWTVLAAAACLYGLIQKAGLDFISTYAEGASTERVFSTFGNPNVFAAFLVLSAAVIFLWPSPSKKPYRTLIFRGLLLVLIFGNIVFTGSRAGLLSFILELFLIVFFFRSKIFLHKKLILFLSCALILVLGWGFYVGFETEARPTQRLEVWKGSVQMFMAKPLKGWGVGQFSLNFSPYVTTELAGQMQKDNSFTEHVHNEVLELGIETGLVGLALAGLFWFGLWGRGFRQSLLSSHEEKSIAFETAGLVIGLFAIGITNLFDYNCRLSGVCFFIWFATAFLANRVYPVDKVRLTAQLGIVIGVLLLGGFAFGMVQETRLLAVVLSENPQGDFLKDLPADLAAEEQNLINKIKTQPEDSANYHELGNIYAKLGKMDDAQKAFEKELALNPQSAGAYLNLGNIYLLSSDNDLGKMQMARECYEKSVELDPKSVEGHFNLAYVYFLHKDLKEALSELNQVLTLDPQNAKALELKRQILP